MTYDRSAIVDATSWEAPDWDRLAVRSPLGHVFQSHTWGELKRPLGWKPRRYVVEIDGAPGAVISFQYRTFAPRWAKQVSPLGYLYGSRGPIVLRPEPALAGAAIRAVKLIAAELGAAVVTVDPEWVEGSDLGKELGRAGFVPAARDVQVSRTGMLVPLSSDEREQHQLLHDTTARWINRAQRKGAAVERIDLASPESHDDALGEMHDMLEATARRGRFPLRDRSYQLAQWRALGKAGLATLWFGHVGGRRWCAAVVVHCGRRLVMLQAASSDDADLRSVPANHLLQWEIIRWGASAGFAAYDLGGVDTPKAPGLPRDPSHPLWNLYLFKRGFGAGGVEYVRAQEYSRNPLLGLAWRLARRLR